MILLSCAGAPVPSVDVGPAPSSPSRSGGAGACETVNAIAASCCAATAQTFDTARAGYGVTGCWFPGLDPGSPFADAAVDGDEQLEHGSSASASPAHSVSAAEEADERPVASRGAIRAMEVGAAAFNAGGALLFPGATATDRDALSLFIERGIANGLSREATLDMLDCVNALLAGVPSAASVCVDRKAVDRLFEKIVGSGLRLYLCTACRAHVFVGEGSTDCVTCDAPRDRATLAYLFFDIEAQLAVMFGRDSFGKDMQDHVHLNTRDGDTFATAYDHSLWTDMEKIKGLEAFGTEPRHGRMQWGADGVDMFSGSWATYSVWPEILSFLNIRPEVRFKRENILLLGVTCGSPGIAEFRVIQTAVNRYVHDLLCVRGVVVRDASAGNEEFVFKAMIYRTGQDGQGIAKAHYRKQGGYCFCYWCFALARKIHGSLVIDGYRRWLTTDCEFYDWKHTPPEGGPWSGPELRGPPLLKTQEVYEAVFARPRAEEERADGAAAAGSDNDSSSSSSSSSDSGPADVAGAETSGIRGKSGFRAGLPYWRALRGDERSAAPDLMHICVNVMSHLINMIHGEGLPDDEPVPSYVLDKMSLRVAFARLQSLKPPPGVSDMVRFMLGKKRKGVPKSIDKIHFAILHLLPFAIKGLMPDGCARARAARRSLGTP